MSPNSAPLISCADRLSRVLNDMNTVHVSNFTNSIQIHWVSVEMNGHDSLGSRSYFGQDLLCVHNESANVVVDEDWLRTAIAHNISACHVGQARHYDFVAWAYSQGNEGKM